MEEIPASIEGSPDGMFAEPEGDGETAMEVWSSVPTFAETEGEAAAALDSEAISIDSSEALNKNSKKSSISKQSKLKVFQVFCFWFMDRLEKKNGLERRQMVLYPKMDGYD